MTRVVDCQLVGSRRWLRVAQSSVCSGAGPRLGAPAELRLGLRLGLRLRLASVQTRRESAASSDKHSIA